MESFEFFKAEDVKNEDENDAVEKNGSLPLEEEEETAIQNNQEKAFAVPDNSERKTENRIKIDSNVHKRFVTRISKFIANNADNTNLDSNAAEKVIWGMGIKPDSPIFIGLMREAKLLLGIKTRDTRDRNRQIEQAKRENEEQVQAGRNWKNEIRKVPVETVDERQNQISENLKRNENDIRWIDEIKDYIKEVGDDPERIKYFWDSFGYIYCNRKAKDGTPVESADLNRTKNGILAELAAEDLFTGWKDHLKSEVDSGKEIKKIEDLSKIEFSIEKATPEQDARMKTDFFVSFIHDGEKIVLPVQVKSDYSQAGWSKDNKFAQNNICSFHGSYKVQPENSLDEKRTKFFKTNDNLGIFVMLPHGCDELEILPNGKPSEKMQKLFYNKLEAELPALIIKLDNMKTYEANNPTRPAIRI